MNRLPSKPEPSDAAQLTSLQQAASDLRCNEHLDDKAIAKRLKKTRGEVHKLMRHPKVTAESVDAALEHLRGSAPLAARALVELLDHSSGYVRSAAASSILDRVGVIAAKEPVKKVKNVQINIVLGAAAISTTVEGSAEETRLRKS